jgi:hypothetical protein
MKVMTTPIGLDLEVSSMKKYLFIEWVIRPSRERNMKSFMLGYMLEYACIAYNKSLSRS